MDSRRFKRLKASRKQMRTPLAPLLSVAAICCAVASSAQEAKRPLLVGGDISALDRIEQADGVYREQGRPGDAVRIMTGNGFNCFRLRLFVDPNGENVVVNDLPYTIRLARRVKAVGARLLLDFHYSDTWADPGQQRKPAAWEHLEFGALERTLHDYSRDSVAAMRRAGVMPDYVQVGNEIAPGMLWPEGRLHGVGRPEQQWMQFARLLRAAVKGVRDGAGEQSVRIVIHIHQGGNWAATKRFFESIEKHGVPYDVIGLSYYPWWHGTIEDVRRTVHGAALTFDKDVWVVETAYPYRRLDVSRIKRGNPDSMHWPMTPEGQARFARQLVQIVRGAPRGRGLGVLWWYPESIRVKGIRTWMGGANALFDEKGNALPALETLGGGGETDQQVDAQQ